MPEFRQNMLTHEWVVIATEWAKRPEDFIKQTTEKPPRPDLRQHLCRTTLAVGQVRGGLSSRLPDCPGGEGTSFRLFRVLQHRTAARGAGIQDAA